MSLRKNCVSIREIAKSWRISFSFLFNRCARTRIHFVLAVAWLLGAPIPSASAGGIVYGWGAYVSRDEPLPDSGSDIVAVSSGESHSLALHVDGTVTAWGKNSFGQADVPPNLNQVRAIAAGASHSLALRADGSVVAWGKSGGRPVVPPVRLSEVSLIGARGESTVTLSRDGLLHAWGVNSYGRRTLARGLENIVAISVGALHTLALKGDGTLLSWGSNRFGQTSPPKGLRDVVAIASGDSHSLALKRDGTVVAWGSNSDGQLNVPDGLSRVKSIAAGAAHSIALLENGSVVAWGKNSHGQALIPTGMRAVSTISAGGNQSLVLSEEPLIALGLPAQLTVLNGHRIRLSVNARGLSPLTYQWSLDGRALLGETKTTLAIDRASLADAGAYSVDVFDRSGRSVRQRSLVRVRELRPNQEIAGQVIDWNRPPPVDHMSQLESVSLSRIAANANDLVALTNDGRVYEFRRDVRRARSLGGGFVPVLSDVRAIAVGDWHRVALRETGRVAAWGSNRYGQLNVPARHGRIVAIACGSNHTLALDADGAVIAWGRDDERQTSVPEHLEEVRHIAAGGALSIALQKNGRLVFWGDVNRDLQRGRRDLLDVTALATGGDHVLALLADGTVVAFGENDLGQSRVPDGLWGVVAIDAVGSRSVALKADGRVVSWGSVTSEVLVAPPGFEVVSVDASSPSSTAGLIAPQVPIIAPMEDEFALVGQRARLTASAQGIGLQYRWEKDGVLIPGATGSVFEHSTVSLQDAGRYSVKVTDLSGRQDAESAELSVFELELPPFAGPHSSLRPGTVVAWGQNTRGQLNIPSGLDDVVAVSAYGSLTIALRAEGRVVAWGGELRSRVPDGLDDVVAISAGFQHALALRRDGSVVAWGANTNQQTSIPPDLKGVIGIAAGRAHSLALLADGAVRAWGGDERGQSTVPMGLKNVRAISAGGNHSLALLGDGSVVAWGDNHFGQSSVPEGLMGVVDIAAADRFSVALMSDGTLVGWGGEDIEDRIAWADQSNIVSISADSGQLLMVFVDGRLGLLGGSVRDFGDVPPGLQGVVGAALGAAHGVAIVSPNSPIIHGGPASHAVHAGHRVSYSVQALGAGPLRYQWFLNGDIVDEAQNSELHLFNVTSEDAGQVVVAVTDRFGNVSLGSGELSVLKKRPQVALERGLALAWGRQMIGQNDEFNLGRSVMSLGVGRDQIVGLRSGGRLVVGRGPRGSEPRLMLDELQEVESIALGSSHGLALRFDGTVVGWGDDRYGKATVPDGLFGVIAVAAGREHSIALKGDGTLLAWGASFDGRIGFPETWENIVAIAAGGEFTLALRADGTVLAQGVNMDGQLSIPPDLGHVVAIAAGGRHSLALRSDGTVAAWGLNDKGQASVPELLGGVLSIAAGENHSLALKSNGDLVSWGSNRFGQLNHPDNLGHVIAIAAGLGVTAVIVHDAPPLDLPFDLKVRRLEYRRTDSRLLLFLGDSMGKGLSNLQSAGVRLESNPNLGSSDGWRARPFTIDLDAGAIVVEQDPTLASEFYRLIVN